MTPIPPLGRLQAVISVIIPTKNGSKYIREVLKSLTEQDFKEFEIIVVDSGSLDGTLKIVKEFPVRIFEIAPDEFDHGTVRNRMAMAAKGEIYVFLTQDAIPMRKDFLRKLTEPFKDPQIAATYGRQIPRPDAKPLERFLREYNYPPKPMMKSLDLLPKMRIRTFHMSNVASAFKKEPFWEVGGFPDPCISNEDMIIAGRLILKGYKVMYVPDAMVLHSHDYKPHLQLKRYFDIAVSLSLNPDIKSYTSSGGEGFKYLRESLRFLLKNRHFRWIPYAIYESLLKFIGFRLGLMEKRLPLWLKKRLSLHTYFWERNPSDASPS